MHGFAIGFRQARRSAVQQLVDAQFEHRATHAGVAGFVHQRNGIVDLRCGAPDCNHFEDLGLFAVVRFGFFAFGDVDVRADKTDRFTVRSARNQNCAGQYENFVAILVAHAHLDFE